MKAIFILFASLMSLVSSAATPPEGVDPVIVNSFESTFANATEVDWKVSEKFVKVQFALDGQYINAFYNTGGELIALTRNVTSASLPVMLQASLKKQTADHWITELFEVTNEEGTSYFVCLENADEKIVLRSSGNKHWDSFSNSRKI